MADGKFLIGKPAGGVTTVTVTDGASNTNLVLPESGTVATLSQVKAEISTGSNLVTTPTGAVGYGTGSGGTVTQLTSKNTAVTLNKPTGQIVMNNSALISGERAMFILNNSLITPNDNVLLTIGSGDISGGSYSVGVSNILVGVVYIWLWNLTAYSRSEVITINFEILKGAVA